MENDEQKTTNTIKCYHCKQTLDISHFTTNSKVYSKCNECRTIINNKPKKSKQICETCGIKARYNNPYEKIGIYCKEHKQVGMIDVTRDLCIKCKKKRPNFNKPNEAVATHCSPCKEVGMIDIKNKKCIKCKNKQPTFNKLNETVATHCSQCKEVGMVDIKNKKCIKCKNKVPTFNKLAEAVATHCGDCKEDDMIDIKHDKCIICNKKRPNFNKPNETIATHCGDCKEDDMIDIKHPKCIRCNNKQPTFNKLNESIATHCGDCKEVGMVDIKNKKCIRCNNKRPNFNKPNETIATHCGDCKEDDMIDIKHPKCIRCNNKRPTFNKSSETIATHCGNCKEDDMVDIINKRCIIYNCNTHPSFGYCGQSPIYCATHRNNHPDKNFLYTKPKRKCIGNDEEDCKSISEYGKTEPTHCLQHKAEDDIHLVAQKCTGCCNNDLLNKDGLCITYCAPNQLYQQVKQEKKKEKLVMNYLDKYVKLSNIINIQDDKVVSTYCNHYRPDRVYDVGTHCIIIEVDEDQHKGKRASCSKGEIGELSRMHEIQNAVGMNCIFLRFNPDTFKVNNKKQSINMNERLKLLVKWIEKCEGMKLEKDLEPVKYKYLFYDDWNETDTSFKEIDDTKLYDK
jgi:hypothetical protein